MIPVYICDDEPAVSVQLEKLIGDQIMMMERDMGPLRVVSSPPALMELQRQAAVPAIYFLDIDFPGYMSGLELAVKLRAYDPRGFIVFITAHGDMMFETFRYRLEALDYIVKGTPAMMAERVSACLESISERMMNEPDGRAAYCTLKVYDTVRHIPLQKILYLEAVGRRHMLVLHMDDEVLEFNSSLSHFEEKLGGDFWRCHRSFLVNRSRISNVWLKENVVELDNGETCLLSRKAKSEYAAAVP
ncbi:MAG: LytTR family DNA-binding domain-containing protein [Lachnospiraceae bacterium]|nr:LytTR family DNA-binding domain-containing protein [Lachnospiraceae bacterium]